MSEHPQAEILESRWKLFRFTASRLKNEKSFTGQDILRVLENVDELTATIAELLRLLERHHAAWIARERVTPKYAMLYTRTELCRETEAVIERAKEKV